MRGDSLFGIPFGLPLFLVIMFALASGSAKQESVVAFMRRKSHYLLLPWFRWSLIYIVVLGAIDVIRGGGPWDRLEPAMVYYGGHPALWFLPFATAGIFAVKGLQTVFLHENPLRSAMFLAAAAFLSTIGMAWLHPNDMPTLARSWLVVSPSIFWGLAIGQSVRARDSRERVQILSGAVGFAILLLFVVPALGLVEDNARGIALAVGLACCGFGIRPHVPESIRWLSGTTFGIYLVHPFVGKALHEVFDVFTWPVVVHAAVTWVLACLGVLALRAAGFSWHELSTRKPMSGTAAGRLGRPTRRPAG
jgi:surface polysaccharide O-acyltransferase-like enzyme